MASSLMIQYESVDGRPRASVTTNSFPPGVLVAGGATPPSYRAFASAEEVLVAEARRVAGGAMYGGDAPKSVARLNELLATPTGLAVMGVGRGRPVRVAILCGGEGLLTRDSDFSRLALYVVRRMARLKEGGAHTWADGGNAADADADADADVGRYESGDLRTVLNHLLQTYTVGTDSSLLCTAVQYGLDGVVTMVAAAAKRYRRRHGALLLDVAYGNRCGALATAVRLRRTDMARALLAAVPTEALPDDLLSAWIEVADVSKSSPSGLPLFDAICASLGRGCAFYEDVTATSAGILARTALLAVLGRVRTPEGVGMTCDQLALLAALREAAPSVVGPRLLAALLHPIDAAADDALRPVVYRDADMIVALLSYYVCYECDSDQAWRAEADGGPSAMLCALVEHAMQLVAGEALAAASVAATAKVVRGRRCVGGAPRGDAWSTRLGPRHINRIRALVDTTKLIRFARDRAGYALLLRAYAAVYTIASFSSCPLAHLPSSAGDAELADAIEERRALIKSVSAHGLDTLLDTLWACAETVDPRAGGL